MNPPAELLVKPPMVPATGRVVRRQNETRDTFTVEVDLGRPLAFEPGQFNMLYAFGTGEVPISISGDPERPATAVHTVRSVGNVTEALRRLKAGDSLGLRGPFGQGWPVQEAEGQDVLVIAGGIGLAPLRPVMYHLLAHRERYRTVALLYGARTPDDLLYRRELRTWRERRDLAVKVTVDHATGVWRGHVGVLTVLLPLVAFEPERTTAMICGPEIMMRVVAQALQRRRVAASRMYVSMERNMQCGIGLCGHCQYGPYLLCRDGPVFRYDQVREYVYVRAL